MLTRSRPPQPRTASYAGDDAAVAGRSEEIQREKEHACARLIGTLAKDLDTLRDVLGETKLPAAATASLIIASRQCAAAASCRAFRFSLSCCLPASKADCLIHSFAASPTISPRSIAAAMTF